MDKIEKIISESKNVVFRLENKKVISVRFETYLDLQLEEGKYYDLNKIYQKDDYYNCIYYLLGLIKRKNYSRSKLIEKLNKKFKKSTIKQVLIHCNSYLIDDEKISVSNLINSYIEKGYGPYKIKHILNDKGYNIKNIDFNKYTYHMDLCVKQFLKTHNDTNKCKLQQKMFRYLYNKGYNSNDIYSYLEKGDIYD